MGDPVLDDLAARGLVQDSTDAAALVARLQDGPITLYAGFDPTADSLHVGNLVPLLLLRRFQDGGHRPIALAGGGTGMVGDPSGRSRERTLLDEEQLAANTAAIKAQLGRFIDLEDRGLLLDNRAWLGELGLLEFLRDTGKHATVNQMVAKESIRSRMDSEDGISYTEFSYMLLQAFDFWSLHRHHDCELQVGGSDQWGNITAGIDLIRRRAGASVHGLTVPLVTRADGAKFGKSQEGNVWLDAERTSPYQLYQFFMQTDDADVERFLLQLTLVPVAEIAEIVAAHAAAPERRAGQRALAGAMTELVHGVDAAAAAAEATDVLFGGDTDAVGEAGWTAVEREVPVTRLSAGELDGLGLVDLLDRTDLASSRGDARRTVDQGGVSVGGVPLTLDTVPAELPRAAGRYLLLRKGKKRYHLVVVD